MKENRGQEGLKINKCKMKKKGKNHDNWGNVFKSKLNIKIVSIKIILNTVILDYSEY